MDVNRSTEPLTADDLKRLCDIAKKVLRDKVFCTPVGGLYIDRLIMVALCQGAAQHYVNGRHGVKDLDVWAFFRAGLAKSFPHRTV